MDGGGWVRAPSIGAVGSVVALFQIPGGIGVELERLKT